MPRHKHWIQFAIAFAAFAGVAVFFLWIQPFLAPPPLKRFEESRLLHQVANLRAYADRESLAGFLPPTDAVVSMREEFVQRALDLSLPIRQEFENGTYEAVLDSAALRMEDGSSWVELTGHGFKRGQANPLLGVALRVQGYLSAEGIRPEEGTLDLGLIVTDVRSASAGAGGVRDWLSPAARYFAGLRAGDWNAGRHLVEIPVRVDQAIEMPAVHGHVKIAGGPVPIAVRVSAVTAYGRRLAVSIEFAERRAGQESLSVDSVFHGESPWTRSLEASVRAASRRDLKVERDSLLAERERLAARVQALADRDTLWRALRDSDRDLCAVIPVNYIERIIQQFVRGYLHETDLDVSGEDIRAKIDEQIKVRLPLGGKVGAGRIKGTLRVLQLTGELKPAGDVEIAIRAPDQLVCRLPVQAVTGRGKIAFDLDWDPAFLTAVLCKGFQYRDTLDGVALPFRAELHGVVHLTLLDSTLVGVTKVRRDKIHVPAVPQPASRARMRQVLAEQDRFSRCGIAINADSTLEKLLHLLGKGVSVRLPEHLFPTFRIPMTMVNEYGAGEFRIHARAYDPEIVLRPAYVRLGFRAGLFVAPAPDSAQKEKAPPQAGAPSSPRAAASPSAALTSGACCSGPAPLRRAPLRSSVRMTPESGHAARSRDRSSSTPGASGACGRPAGRAVHPA